MVSVNTISMTEKLEELEWILSIRYFVTFKDQTEALLDSGSEVNVMSQAFAQQLGLKIRKTNIGASKINGTILKTYSMIFFLFRVG